MKPPSQPRLAVAAIFKNEGPYILEWVAFHRVMGADRFFIADNNSSDETTEILGKLAAAGIVTHIPFPTPPDADRPPQLLAYEKILADHAGDADWIAFIDADEFLVPRSPRRISLGSIVSDLDPGPEVGAIVVNWALYGSSGHKEAGPEPVIERFTRRAKREDQRNFFYKSIIRPGHYDGAALKNSHYFSLKEGSRTVHVDGTPLIDAPERAKCFSAEVIWKPLRVNHYVVKSWEEFYHRKRTRGRGMRVNEFRNEAFFRHHDRNEIQDPVPDWLVAAAAAERRRLEALIAAGVPDQPAAVPAGGSWKRSVAGLLGRTGGAVETAQALRPSAGSGAEGRECAGEDRPDLAGHAAGSGQRPR